jgi:hypothetical protein
MPTLIRESGFEVRIYTLDHPPPHVHIEKAGAAIKIDLATSRVVRVVGTASDRDIRRAERLVEKHLRMLNDAWRELHGRR